MGGMTGCSLCRSLLHGAICSRDKYDQPATVHPTPGPQLPRMPKWLQLGIPAPSGPHAPGASAAACAGGPESPRCRTSGRSAHSPSGRLWSTAATPAPSPAFSQALELGPWGAGLAGQRLENWTWASPLAGLEGAQVDRVGLSLNPSFWRDTDPSSQLCISQRVVLGVGMS